MKLAVVSDIHGNLAALHAVLDDIARHHVEAIVNLGDILSGPLQAAATADLLMPLGLATIAGNHERQLLKVREKNAASIDRGTSDGYAALDIEDRHADWLRSLPAQQRLAGDDVLLVHGTPASDLTYWLETVVAGFGTDGSRGLRAANAEEVAARLGPADGASLILCGHTHVPRAVACGRTLIVNPGSVGLQAYDDSHPHYHCVENGSPDARYAIVERRAAGWHVELRSVPYDWQPQARIAGERGRPDWAYALATGRMPPVPATMQG